MEAPVPGKTHFRFLAIAIWAALAVTLAVAVPGVSAGGDEDQAPPIPDKTELKYPTWAPTWTNWWPASRMGKPRRRMPPQARRCTGRNRWR